MEGFFFRNKRKKKQPADELMMVPVHHQLNYGG